MTTQIDMGYREPVADPATAWPGELETVLDILRNEPDGVRLQTVCDRELNDAVLHMAHSGHPNADAVYDLLMPMDRNAPRCVQSLCWSAGKRFLDGQYDAGYRTLTEIIDRLETARAMLT